MEYSYIVIILNYNSFEYIQKAVVSLEKCAVDNYLICIVDNDSTNVSEQEKLLSIKNNNKNIDIVLLKENKGYGNGNNRAFDYIYSRYKSEYIVIMNPDVELMEVGTIESIIALSKADKAVGGQPLVWNYYYGDSAKSQINIGKSVNYFDLCIQSSLVLRLLCKKRFNSIMYIDYMPYNTNIRYHMPSGAFFIIKTEVFKEIQGFDEDTFLYGEETILAYKLFNLKKHMLFCPEYMVKHMQGASTGYDRYRWTIDRLKFIIQSRNVYMRKYLKSNRIQILFLDLLLFLDYIIRKLYVTIIRFK